MIPKTFIQEVLDRTNIEHLITRYVPLKRAGSRLVGLCPFHNEKTPSFTVFSSENSFYCFGCGTGGDAITFIKKIENLDYPDAIEFLAKQIGLTVPQEVQNFPQNKPKVERKRVLDMNREAAKFFHKCLFADTPEAKSALNYLTNNRGLDLGTIRHFGIGFAPNQFDALSTHLASLGYTPLEMVEGFIGYKNERTGKIIDSFRNRVMFPIIDPAGNVIAFGGRVMDDSQPKYKNTSDTPAFKKSKNLFALNFAKDACAERMILCEGYMDVISLHASGFENAVATLGTAITPDQARMMSRYTKQIIISYDMDEAGRKAADKAMKLFEEVGLEVKLLKLEDAKDPDEYIKKFGRESFRKKLEASDSKFVYNLDRIMKKYDVNEPQQKIDAISDLLHMISDFPSASEREVYLREISRRLDVGIESLHRDLKRIFAKKEKARRQAESQELIQKTMGYRDDVNPDFVKAPAIVRYEEAVLGMILLHPELLSEKNKNKVSLTEEDFFSEFGKRVFAFVLMQSQMKADTDSENINEVFTPEEVGRITKMKVSRMLLTDNSTAVFVESVDALKKARTMNQVKTGIHSMDALQALISRKKNSDEQ